MSNSINSAESIGKVAVFWLLRGDRAIASSRLQGYLIHEEFQRNQKDSFDSELVLAPPIWLYEPPWDRAMCRRFGSAAAGAVVVLQKMFGEEFLTVPQLIRDSGGRTLFVHSDLDEENQIPFLCDLVIVPSRVLAEWYESRGCKNVRVIRDPNEDVWKERLGIRATENELRIGWIGHENNWETLKVLRDVLAEPEFSDFELVTISNHESASITWSTENVLAALPTFDLAVIPFGDSPELRYKSANRATLFMGAGIPVVVGRLPAYEEVIRHGENGFVFDDAKTLKQYLRVLRSPAQRDAVGAAAYADVARTFTVSAAAKEWEAAINSLSPPDRNTSRSAKDDTNMRQLQFENSMMMCELARRQNRHTAAFEYIKSALKIGLRHPGNGRVLRPLKTLAAMKGIYGFSSQRTEW